MSEGNEGDDQKSSSRMVRMRFTLLPAHAELLDELADTRYESRSEAVRAALNRLADTLDDDGESEFELVLDAIDSLSEDVCAVKDSLNEIEAAGKARALAGRATHAQNVPEQAESTQAVTAVFKVLNEFGECSLDKIAELSDHDLLTIRRAVDQLRDEGHVDELEDTGKFRINH